LSPPEQQKWAPLIKSLSINDPGFIRGLPEPLRNAVETVFVNALHPLFVVSAAVSLLAMLLCLFLPDHELAGVGPGRAPGDGEKTAEELEASTATLV
jgi:hypothetical protein